MIYRTVCLLPTNDLHRRTGNKKGGIFYKFLEFSFLVVFFDNSLLLCVKIMTKSCETSHCQSLIWSSIRTPNSGKTWWRLRPQLGRQREGMAESSDILNLPVSVTCALSYPSDYIHTDVVLLQGLPITLCSEPSSFYSTARVACYRNLCPMNVSTVSQIKQTMNCHVFRCQQLTSVTIVLF